jgi:ABC-2 type transport system ATP-binding protein
MIKANVGELEVLGQKPWMNTEMHAKLGLCPDFDNLSDDMTGKEFLKLSGGLHAMSGASLEKRIPEVSEIVGMTDAIGRKIGGYSKGMRQRIKIAGTILHEPELLLLDEPLAGTDPLARKEIMDLIQSLHKELGHNILVSSHVLFEVERMTKNVALVYKGRAVAAGHISEIRGLIDKHPHNIVIEGDNLEKLAKKLLERDYTVSVGYYPERKSIWVQVSKPEDFFYDIPKIVTELQCKVTKIHSLDDNLEAVFKYLVGW